MNIFYYFKIFLFSLLENEIIDKVKCCRFSLFNHPEVTKEFLERNNESAEKKNLFKEFAIPGYEVFDKMPSPRFIKSHFPLSSVPNVLKSGCKVS